MARSVSTHRHAVETVYLTLQDDLDPDFGWQDFVEDLKQVLNGSAGAPGGKGFPSLRECDRWAGREDHVILENGHAEISVSEYCGLVAVCLAPLDPDNGLQVAWCERAAKGFRSLLHGAYSTSALVSQGRFSNGEQVFQLVNTPGSCVTSKEGRLW